MNIVNLHQRLAFFYELIGCGHALYHTVLDPSLQLADTNCPFSAHIPALLNWDEDAPSFFASLADEPLPVMIAGCADLLWILDFEKAEDALLAFHLIGPVFLEDVSVPRLEAAISALGIYGGEKHELVGQLTALPIFPINRWMDYGLMLHYSLYGQRLDSGSFHFVDRKIASSEAPEQQRPSASHGTWAMEQELLRLIEEGNLDYRKRMGRLVERGQMVPLGAGDTLRHVKNSIIIFTALCTRAAIRGGLSPEVAYTLSDRYINSAESAGSFEEAASINSRMQDDFVQRVHDCRYGQVSPLFQKLFQYLDTHLENTPSMPDIAKEMGYSVSYLAREFKKQTGQTMQQYLRSRRIELARLALLGSNDSIQNICHSLGFSSQSYFTAEFRKAVGMTPTAYRQRNGVEA